MKVVSVKVDDQTKAKMKKMKDVNWSEVIRRAIAERIELEESLQNKIDRRRAMRASEEMEKLRHKTSGIWNGVEEIRKWREARH